MANSEKLQAFYAAVQENGKLISPTLAVNWSRATLQQFGLLLPRAVKKRLAKELPEELAGYLNGVFWLAHFPDKSMSMLDFQERVARRSGNTDKLFARLPVNAVFAAAKAFTNSQLDKAISEALSPELRDAWEGKTVVA